MRGNSCTFTFDLSFKHHSTTHASKYLSVYAALLAPTFLSHWPNFGVWQGVPLDVIFSHKEALLNTTRRRSRAGEALGHLLEPKSTFYSTAKRPNFGGQNSLKRGRKSHFWFLSMYREYIHLAQILSLGP